MLAVANKNSVDSNGEPVVVLAADDSFGMPLAATIRSALDHLAPERRLDIYVLDGGLSDATKQRLERSWPEGRCRTTWVDVDATALADVPTSGHANLVNYYRILMPWLLPQELGRVIYLDADLIIRTDLTRLWDCELGDRHCLAVQDSAAPYFDSSAALANYDRCGPHLGSSRPVANFQELGLDPLGAYFNSGVLMVNLDAWRNADLPRQMLVCLERNQQHVRWWDQYALNVVLAGRWGQLDPQWNQGSHIFAYPNWASSPYDRETYQRLREDPYIVHFTTRYKPWNVSCLHPLRRLFFEYVDRTDWAGWRPARFSHPRAWLELLKTQDRRMRLARRRLYWQFHEWRQSVRQPTGL